MSRRNGDAVKMVESQLVLVQADNVQLRAQVRELIGSLQVAHDQAVLATHAIATIMHRNGTDSTWLTDDHRRAAHDYCRMRVKTEIIAHEDQPNSLRLSLVLLTTEEQTAIAKAAEKKVDDDKPKIIEP